MLSGRRLCLMVVLAGALSLLFAGSSAAADACPTDPTTHQPTCVFNFTAGEQTFTVPAGVASITVTATGAGGGSGGVAAPGGKGAVVTASLPVTSGDVLYVEVGGAPTGTGCGETASCVGGFNGGGSSEPLSGRGGLGGGGGGASDSERVLAAIRKHSARACS